MRYGAPAYDLSPFIPFPLSATAFHPTFPTNTLSNILFKSSCWSGLNSISSGEADIIMCILDSRKHITRWPQTRVDAGKYTRYVFYS